MQCKIRKVFDSDFNVYRRNIKLTGRWKIRKYELGKSVLFLEVTATRKETRLSDCFKYDYTVDVTKTFWASEYFITYSIIEDYIETINECEKKISIS